MGQGAAQTLYTGDRGVAYHQQRAASRSDYSQRVRAGYFADLPTSGATVLDFGCGTGGVLKNLAAARRIGIELNETARSEALLALDQVVADIESIPSHSVDVLISFHALEHTRDPAYFMQQFRRVLVPGGHARIIVPCESILLNRQQREWRPDDIDMHLFRWSPLTIGNLATVCGLEVVSARLSPMSGGGKLAALLRPVPALQRAAIWTKALRHGRIQTILDARAPSKPR